jgi:cell division protein ZapA
MSPSTKVQIYNQTYSLQGDLDQAYLQELAGFVDAKMHAIANMTSMVDTQRVAVLTALAIADELNSLRKEKSDREELLKEQAERCLTLVERALKQSE